MDLAQAYGQDEQVGLVGNLKPTVACPGGGSAGHERCLELSRDPDHIR